MPTGPCWAESLVAAISVACVSFSQGIAETLRAALTRLEGAILDFYDIDYVVQKLSLRI
jgi:hypothetical protein